MKTTINNLNQVTELKLVYKLKYKISDRPQIQTSNDCYTVFLGIWNTEIIEFIEEFKILLLNRANRVLGYYDVSTGGLCGTIADPRVIFAAAIKSCASGIILCHNHPSGNIKPSNADLQLTQKLKAGGKILDIEILDHIIITANDYFSFTDNGVL